MLKQVKNERVDIICILDRSGSMEGIRDASISGFNEFIHAQKQVPGEATISVFLFDDHFDVVYRNKSLQDSPELNRDTFVPRGMTAMNDAIGRVLTEYKSDADKVIICILTDGGENFSKNYTTREIADMITKERDKGTEFVFLAANQDAFAVGRTYNFDPKLTFNYAADNLGTMRAFSNMSNTVAGLRTDNSNDLSNDLSSAKTGG